VVVHKEEEPWRRVRASHTTARDERSVVVHKEEELCKVVRASYTTTRNAPWLYRRKSKVGGWPVRASLRAGMVVHKALVGGRLVRTNSARNSCQQVCSPAALD